MSREQEIAQGLRDEGGALIGGLYVEEYVRGITDYDAGIDPPRMTTTSYDLGRARASEKAERKREFMAWQERENNRRAIAMREALKNHPDVLAEYEAKIAEIRNRAPQGVVEMFE